MHNRKAVTKVLYHAFVILFGFMMVYPVLWMISGSFKGNAEILRGTLSLIPKELKLTNYATGWKGFGGTTFATFFTELHLHHGRGDLRHRASAPLWWPMRCPASGSAAASSGSPACWSP